MSLNLKPFVPNAPKPEPELFLQWDGGSRQLSIVDAHGDMPWLSVGTGTLLLRLEENGTFYSPSAVNPEIAERAGIQLDSAGRVVHDSSTAITPLPEGYGHSVEVHCDDTPNDFASVTACYGHSRIAVSMGGDETAIYLEDTDKVDQLIHALSQAKAYMIQKQGERNAAAA